MRLRYKIPLLIIGILIIVGFNVSYSYYQSIVRINNSNLNNVNASTVKLLQISYDSVKVESFDLIPGESVEKDIKIKIIPGSKDKDVKYKIELFINEVTNPFLKCQKNIADPCKSTYKDEEICSLYSTNNCSSTCVINKCTEGATELTYSFYEVDENNNAISSIKTASLLEGENIILLSPTEGISKTVNEETNFMYKLVINFEDTNADQNHNMNKEFKSDVKVSLIG